eukprot:GILK01014448.1.p1 GENE.GILK01014448.1~~GILK01014448.1.p1  ORF type:complete len:475 (-),score=79.50 GILK01014448.1:344-1768(-)
MFEKSSIDTAAAANMAANESHDTDITAIEALRDLTPSLLSATFIAYTISTVVFVLFSLVAFFFVRRRLRFKQTPPSPLPQQPPLKIVYDRATLLAYRPTADLSPPTPLRNAAIASGMKSVPFDLGKESGNHAAPKLSKGAQQVLRAAREKNKEECLQALEVWKHDANRDAKFMAEEGKTVFNAAMTLCVEDNDHDSAYRIFNDMLDAGVEVESHLYEKIIGLYCQRQAQVREARGEPLMMDSHHGRRRQQHGSGHVYSSPFANKPSSRPTEQVATPVEYSTSQTYRHKQHQQHQYRQQQQQQPLSTQTTREKRSLPAMFRSPSNQHRQRRYQPTTVQHQGSTDPSMESLLAVREAVALHPSVAATRDRLSEMTVTGPTETTASQRRKALERKTPPQQSSPPSIQVNVPIGSASIHTILSQYKDIQTRTTNPSQPNERTSDSMLTPQTDQDIVEARDKAEPVSTRQPPSYSSLIG